MPSSSRIIALGKILVALAKAEDALRTNDGDEKRSPSAIRRKNLHILYLLNDLLHHTKYHMPNSSLFSTFIGSIQPFVVSLVQLASVENRPKIRKRIDDLLQAWEEEAYFSKDYVDKLRETATNSASGAENVILLDGAAFDSQSAYAKDQPYVMPASHGDPYTPYYDLPAGNMMPHIMPNKSVPIRPDDVRALQFVAGPADDSLVVAVKDFMTAVEKIDDHLLDFGYDEGIVGDVDQLGQPLLRDEVGVPVAGRTYYGWSREFCEKMKGRRGRNDGRPGRRRSYSSSRSRSRSPRKRRRYSDGASSSSASYSRSRSTDRSPYESGNVGRGHTSSDKGRSSSRSRPYSSAYKPAMTQSDTPPAANTAPLHETPVQNSRPAYPLPESIVPPPPIPLLNMDFNQTAFPPPPVGPGGLLIPPPPPVNYSGPWPPPPPPLPPHGAFNIHSSVQPFLAAQGFPKPPSYQGGQPHRGGGNKWPQ